MLTFLTMSISPAINPCLVGSGGCSNSSECVHTGPNKVTKAKFKMKIDAYVFPLECECLHILCDEKRENVLLNVPNLKKVFCSHLISIYIHLLLISDHKISSSYLNIDYEMYLLKHCVFLL